MNLATLPVNKETRTIKIVNQEGESCMKDVQMSDVSKNMDNIQHNNIETGISTFLDNEKQKVSCHQQSLDQRKPNENEINVVKKQ